MILNKFLFFFCEDKRKLYLNYYKFIDILLNEFISKEILDIIKDIFKKIEKYLVDIGQYEINLIALKDIYNTKNNYYQYDEKQALNDFCDNFIRFHYDFYLSKLYAGKDKRFINNKNEYNSNFIINLDEFLEFYKMISFIIEKNDMFNNIIYNEWESALASKKNEEYNNENNYEKNENINKDDDDYDDYDDYNINKNDYSPKKISYIKLKKDLAVNPANNNIYNKKEYIATENTYNKMPSIII